MLVEYESTVLHSMNVKLPSVKTDQFDFEKLFIMAGFKCIGSTYENHVRVISCSVWTKINYLGPKLKKPSRSRNASVTHSLQTLGTTSGNPVTWNNKTIILCDESIRGVHEGNLFNNHKYTLLEHDEAGEVVE